MRLRTATPSTADITAITQLARDVFHATYPHIEKVALGAYLDKSYSEEAIRRDLGDPAKHVIVAEDGSNDDNQAVIIGFAFLSTDSSDSEPCITADPTILDPVELMRIYVHQNHQGTGVAKALMDASLDWCKVQGYQDVWLGVFPENKRAVRFYQKYGFEKIGTHAFSLGGHVDVDDIMVKRLSP